MMADFDVCVIGSGAGAGPVAWTIAKVGYSVVVLEKGPWFSEKDFFKDELACCRRDVYTPLLKDEQHVIEEKNDEDKWEAIPTSVSGENYWNGNCVGGSSNFMSGFFYRLKPEDFRLLSTFGPIEGANIVDWPISYEDLEPYYTQVESVVGISGNIIPHKYLEPRSTKNFPYPPTLEHPISKQIDSVCYSLGLNPLPVPRAILPHQALSRNGCSYSDYCGSYGCATGAKGSSRAALLDHAVKFGHCEIRPHSKVYKLVSNKQSQVIFAEYYDKEGNRQKVNAKIFVVACQAIETCRLLLSSPGPKHPNGLANNYNQVGKNLIFSGGGTGSGDLFYNDFNKEQAEDLKTRMPFVNRVLQDWYFIEDLIPDKKIKGGIVSFLFRHPNLILQAQRLKWVEHNGQDQLIWGHKLKKRLKSYFTEAKYLIFEVYCDWLPTNNCFVTLDPRMKDKWGTPVARVRIGHHKHDLKVGSYLAKKAEEVLHKFGAKNIVSNISGLPPTNLVAGGCRFGKDPKHSVLDSNCRAHDVENLYVTDGSFMPTGGSVPYTWTIYANAFRVAERIVNHIGGNKNI